ncbi:MAG TPA: stage II sporulation protein P [Anaerovoracaceae bacterium]|nr:stage II sporulation protein P [Anaerovoracaceae bacterium]
MRRSYGGYSGRKRTGSGRLAILTVLFWAVSGFIMVGFIHGWPTGLFGTEKEDVGKMYIDNIFPSVSRSADYESRAAMSNSLAPAADQPDGLLNAQQSKSIFKSMVGSMFPGAEVLDDDLAEEDPGIIFDTAPDDTGTAEPDGAQETADVQEEEPAGISPSDADYSKPVVIIYHTHATESYQPVSEGNFHSLDAYGTVREVGNELAKALEAHGIQVIHDTTINDSPSYNQSYTRSLETVKKLLGDNGSNVYVIDLHRDAAAYIGNVPITTSVDNDTIAKYNLVVGTGNPNAAALRQFADQVNKTAEEVYSGFGGRVIEKPYKFNQYVSDRHILLEIGNNQNTIEEAKLTGKYFGDVMAKVVQDSQQ